MYTDDELFQFLPTRRTHVLAQAIGRRLVEVERQFLGPMEQFVAQGRFSAEQYFSRESGPTQLHFEGDVLHVLAVWSEQLSIVVLPEPLDAGVYWGDAGERLYKLSQMTPVSADLVSCLGQVCEDVHIWKHQGADLEEAREVAVSYVLSGGRELFYCILVHGDLDDDYLVLRDELPARLPARCYSVAQQNYIDEVE